MLDWMVVGMLGVWLVYLIGREVREIHRGRVATVEIRFYGGLEPDLDELQEHFERHVRGWSVDADVRVW